jgi:hypothetical protein
MKAVVSKAGTGVAFQDAAWAAMPPTGSS